MISRKRWVGHLEIFSNVREFYNLFYRIRCQCFHFKFERSLVDRVTLLYFKACFLKLTKISKHLWTFVFKKISGHIAVFLSKVRKSFASIISVFSLSDLKKLYVYYSVFKILEFIWPKKTIHGVLKIFWNFFRHFEWSQFFLLK